SCASRSRWLSWPSSHAMRNWRPLIVTVTCDMISSTGRMDTSTIVRLNHGSNGLDGGIEPPGNLLVGVFQCACSGGHRIKIAGQPRAVGAERMQLIGHAEVGVIGLA